MKKIVVGKIQVPENQPLEKVSMLLDDIDEEYLIDTVNWPGYENYPSVRVKLAYSSTELFIKYYVSENFVKAEYDESNQPVYQDSCVEFFVTPISDGPYYNFEFNAIGTCLMQKGMSRHDREVADPELIRSIRRLSSLGSEPFAERKGEQSWELTIALPLRILFGKPEPELSGRIIRANLYKCGDKLSQPHFLSWNPIETEKPDFHRPEYFGILEFI